MARIAKGKEYSAKTIGALLDRWANIPREGTTLSANETGLNCALPMSREAFKPNAPLMYGLISALDGSMRNHFTGSGANYNSFMSMFSRWKKDAAELARWTREIEGYATSAEKVAEVNSDDYQSLKQGLGREVTGWVSYDAWIKMLGKARVLSAPVIMAVPRHRQAEREALQRMHREWLELGGEELAVEEARIEQVLPVVEQKHALRGGVAMPTQIYDAVGAADEVGGVTIDGLAERTAVFSGYSVRDDIREAMAGRVFVNCVFKDVTFRGDMTGATFLACDFEGKCGIAPGVEAESLLFRQCRTFDDPLGLANLTLTGIAFVNCGGMRVNVRRSGMMNSRVENGWVDCGRLAEDRAKWDDAPRVAPRSLAGAVWSGGGLDFDLLNLPDAERGETMFSTVAALVVPGSVRTQMVSHPEQAGLIDNCGAIAEQLLDQYGRTTREVALTQWQIADDETLEAQLLAEEASARKRRTAPAAPRDTESGMSELEKAIARG